MSKCSQQNHRELTGRFCSIHSFQLFQYFVVNPLWGGQHKAIVLLGTKEPAPRMNHGPSGHGAHGVNSNERSDFYRLLLKTLKDLNYNEKKS